MPTKTSGKPTKLNMGEWFQTAATTARKQPMNSTSGFRSAAPQIEHGLTQWETNHVITTTTARLLSQLIYWLSGIRRPL